jgi:hypothetical protein
MRYACLHVRSRFVRRYNAASTEIAPVLTRDRDSGELQLA